MQEVRYVGADLRDGDGCVRQVLRPRSRARHGVNSACGGGIAAQSSAAVHAAHLRTFTSAAGNSSISRVDATSTAR